MKENLTIEKLRTRGDNVIKAVFNAIDKAPNVAIIGEQSKTEPRKWALLGDDRTKYAKIIKECTKLVEFKEDSYIPNKKDKIPLKKWDKLIDKVTKMIK
ncbi:MAG: hypothetical protein ACTSRE_00370 [Promethearchaeota archaeon]